MNHREMGTYYEGKAVQFLMDRGVRIVERNYRTRQGEIDIIGYDDTCLVFFEVKARTSLRAGLSAEAVTYKKQKIICRVADYYRMKHGIGDFVNMRYDCITIDGEALIWIKNAFMHIGR